MIGVIVVVPMCITDVWDICMTDVLGLVHM